MKGISNAIETVIYLILGVTVLSILLFFFLSQAGPAQDQYSLEAGRNRYCGAYTINDPTCEGEGSGPKDASPELLKNIGTTCTELQRRFGFKYDECSNFASLECIQKCCLTCPQR